jgi:hypothetical protein
VTREQIEKIVASLDRESLEQSFVDICEIVSRSGTNDDDEEGDYEWSDALEAIYGVIADAVPLK